MRYEIPLVFFMLLFGAGTLLSGCGDKAEQATDSAAKTDSASSGAASTVTDGATANGEQVAVSGLDAHPGKALHDSNCISCHDSKVYTRGDRKIMDFSQLGAQVRRCDANLGTTLFDEELDQIADYLNQAYYKFDK